MKLLHSIFFLIARLRVYILITAIAAAGLYYYNYSQTETASAQFYAVTTVDQGTVSSGIETTGTIMAAQKLDVDVYKQQSRIDVVNVTNGGHVETDDVMISFDKSDVYVESASAQVSLTAAALDLQTEQANYFDPNTTVRTLTNQIAGYKKAITDAAADMEDAYLDFLNTDLEVVPHTSQKDRLADIAAPVLSGTYVNTTEGTYTIKIFSSAAESGYSFAISGLESDTSPVVFNKAVNLGSQGLKITFSQNIKSGDLWVVSVPNTTIATYTETKETYTERIADLTKTVADNKVLLANAEQELANSDQTDDTAHRSLTVQQAQSTLSEAQQRLAETL